LNNLLGQDVPQLQIATTIGLDKNPQGCWTTHTQYIQIWRATQDYTWRLERGAYIHHHLIKYLTQKSQQKPV